MNAFEQKITAEYTQNHSVSLFQDAMKTAEEFSSVADPAQTFEREMGIASRNRFVYLALREYHAALSRYLAESGIVLPDLDTLIAESAPASN